MSSPIGIYILHVPHGTSDKGAWNEPVQVYTQENTIYVAHLIHADSRAVTKVAHDGITLACFPNKETVDRVEHQIARQQVQH